MYVSRLSVTDFRSYEQADLTLEPGVTVLVGSNGQGKTNLVEAIGFAATLDSHRVAQAAPLVRIGSERAIVRVEVVRDERPTLVELEINPGSATRGQLNRSRVQRARDVLGYVRTVLFAPEDLALVKGDPAERRAFLDTLMTARNPRMAGVRADYDRVLKQRNALLKSARQSRKPDPHFESTLSVWDGQLSALGAELVSARLELVELLGPLATSAYARVAPEGSARVVSMAYISSLKEHMPESRDREALVAAFAAAAQERRREEMDRGISLIGPHRDDLALSLGPAGAPPVPAKGFASHGESWSLALALKLASFWLLREDGHGEPVLILDDVFAELDAERRERLAAVVADAEQVLITAAVLADIPTSLDGARCLVTLGSVSHV